MKLPKQCCTSAQSFKLKELGITQERLLSNYTWEIKDGPSYWFHYQPPFVYAEDAHRFATAFTVAELWVMLPHELIDDDGIRYTLSATKDHDRHLGQMSYTIGYYNFNIHKWFYGVGTSSIPESAAELLIRLIENGKYMNFDINERLKNG